MAEGGESMLNAHRQLGGVIPDLSNGQQSHEDQDQFDITSKVSLSTIANLLGLNSPRGTSLGGTSLAAGGSNGHNQYAAEMHHHYGTPPGTAFADNMVGCGDSRCAGILTPPTKKKRFFDTPPSPDYSAHEAAFNRAKRSMRGFGECDSPPPPPDKGSPLATGGGGSASRSGSPTDSGIGLGNSLPDTPRFMDNIADLVGKLRLNPDYPTEADYTRMPRGRSASGSSLSLGPYVPLQPLRQQPSPPLQQQQMSQSPPCQPPLSPMAYYHHQRQLVLNHVFEKQQSWLAQQMMTSGPDGALALERAARYHRTAAALCDATCTWSGLLPPRHLADPGEMFSCKVFLGGVPWDMTEGMLFLAFRQFGNVRIDWPGKETANTPLPKGFVYVIFENDKQVKTLLASCSQDANEGGQWYFKISSRKMKAKDVQVIPWLLTDSNYSKTPNLKLDPQKTVFVGALHGMMNSEGLYHVMNELFENVIYAGIDTDKYKYPIGSGRVTFNNPRSYMRAVAAAFVEIKSAHFSKKVQVDPYLEDALCSSCHIQQGPYFCREMTCFRYFCRNCWQWNHSTDSTRAHNPLMRNSKISPSIGFSAGPRTPK